MNNKGNIMTFFVIIVVLFISAVMLFAGYIVVSSINATGVFNSVETAQYVVDSGQNTLLSMDNMMFFIVIGLGLFVIISGSMVFNHPGFFIISILLLFIAITVAGSVSNAFAAFADGNAIAATASLYPKTNFIMDYLPFYLLLVGCTAAVMMYMSWRQQ